MARRIAVDPSGIQCEVNGRTWYRFSASYRDAKREFIIEFWALNFPDAHRRVDLMRSTLTFDGQDISERYENVTAVH